MYRANLPRTFSLVVALVSMVATTGAFAREFRAAETQGEDYPTIQALRYMGSLIGERSGGRSQICVFHSRQLGEDGKTGKETCAGATDSGRTNVAPIGTFVPAMAGDHEKAIRAPATAELIDRIRKVE